LAGLPFLLLRFFWGFVTVRVRPGASAFKHMRVKMSITLLLIHAHMRGSDERGKIMIGRVAEWFKAPVLKTGRGLTLSRGFESHPFRQLWQNVLYLWALNGAPCRFHLHRKTGFHFRPFHLIRVQT
jgi:hypothetical protein